MNAKTALDAARRRALLAHPAGWIAAGFGAGLAPFAQGTSGSLAALLPWWFVLRELPWPAYAGVLALAFALGVWACGVAGARLGVDDHRALVWDEFVGQWLALFAAPAGWPWMLAGFALFRLFDVWKPWPIRWFDRRVKGGLGVMLDDLLAGVAAALVLQLAARFA
ncbi:MAG: phosphatidylglycerophosphatase A [Mizugakiibacter sp.]|uniref:phosphatidylglycerophosphatase A family protein n=1 Tax=Mizugakiibacter sp. TaxID=1972610 RepID=UPI0031BE3C8F|nr:phosphatidylglycerophosphatase A [Xanthomonadaceae bacterium]